MSENCNHNCKDCKENCGERKTMLVDPHPTTHIGKVIGVVSGKGGVGKSLTTSLLAAFAKKQGLSVGIPIPAYGRPMRNRWHSHCCS